MMAINNCEELNMIEVIWDPIKYTELTDYQVLQKIRFSNEQKVCIFVQELLHFMSSHFFIKARETLKNIEKRKLYKCIGYFVLTENVCCIFSCIMALQR